MKQFLYLDTDIVNSIIAQSEQGLMQSFSDEKVSSETEADSSKIAANVNAQLGGSLAKLVKAEDKNAPVIDITLIRETQTC